MYGDGLMRTAEGSTLQTDVEAAFEEVQRWLSAFLSAFPEPPTRASQLKELLSANYAVCWNIFEVIKSSDALAGARHVPPARSVQKMLAAARGRGVPADTAEGVRNALSRFDWVVQSHSGDRDTFATMVASMGGRAVGGQPATLACRRTAFRQDSQLWGAQIGVLYARTTVRRESAGFDEVNTILKASFMCLRSGVRPILWGQRDHDTPDAQPAPMDTEPLDPEAQRRCGAPLLSEFSTRPLPRLAKIKAEDGWVYDAIETDKLGLSGAVNMASGIRKRSNQATTLENGARVYWDCTGIVTPTELAVLELAVHRPSFGPVNPAFRFVPMRGHSFLSELTADVPQIPSAERLVPLGPADRVIPAIEVKDYARLSAYTFDRVGWDPSEFDVFQVTVPYPILNSMAVMWFPLADE